jgi:hypothetical protein
MTVTDKSLLITESVTVTRIEIHPAGEEPDQHAICWCNTPTTLGLSVVTPDMPLGSYTSPTDQPYSFMCTFVLTYAHLKKLFGSITHP